MTRRSRGSGSVRYNAARGRYEAVLVVGGSKHTRTVPSPEPNERWKREAEALLAKLSATYGRLQKRHTVASYLEEWLEHMESRVAHGTHEGHAGRVRNHIVPALGKVPLEELSARHIDRLMDRLTLAPSTIGLVRKTLSAALNQAERWELIPRNPVALSRAPRIPNVERQTLSPAQALTFLEHVQGDRLEALWNLAACLGLRSGEVRGMTWDAINPASSPEGERRGRLEPGLRSSARANLAHPSATTTLHVTQSLGYQPGQWDLHEPKTPRSRRTLALPAFIAELLERRRETQRFEAKSYGYSNPMGLVFTMPDGYPISSQWLNERLGVLLGEAGLPRITVHDLRHCAASLLLAKGVPVRAVQDILGHATAQMTLGVYASSDDAQRRAAANELETWRAQ